MSAIHYARGRSKYDNRPQAKSAPDFPSFIDALDRDRASRKGLQWFSGPFNGDGKRRDEGTLPRRFLPVDLDRISLDIAPELRIWFTRFSGCAWRTHSSTDEAPRERVVIELSRDASRVECESIGAVLKRDIEEEFGAAIHVDDSTFRSEQPNYCAPVGVTFARFAGEPLDVDQYLEHAPPATEKPSKSAKIEGAIGGDPVLQHLNARGIVHQVGNDGKAWIHCPFEAQHTAPAKPFGTVWYCAHTNGYKRGHFKCLHQHCAKRTDAEFLEAVEFVSRATEKPRSIPRGESGLELLRRTMSAPALLCDPWAPEGLTLVASRPKLGKTTLLRQKAAAIGSGGSFFGSRCKQAGVLFLCLEEGDRLNKRKLELAQFTEQELASFSFHYKWERGERGAEDIGAYLDAYPDVRYVVVDSLTRFRAVPDARTQAFIADYEAVSMLQGVAKARPGVAIDLIHHTKKVKSDDPIDDISGTYGLSAACDTYWVMRHHIQGAALHIGGRYWDRDESEFGLMRDNQRWQLVDKLVSLTASQLKTMEVIRRLGECTPSSLGDALSESKMAAFSKLKALSSAGALKNIGGIYVPL